jgi:hypothetical protein
MPFRIVGVDERGLPIFAEDAEGYDEDSFLDRQEAEAQQRLEEAKEERRNQRFAEAAEQLQREPEEGPPPVEATPEEAAAQQRRAALTGATTAASRGELQQLPMIVDPVRVGQPVPADALQQAPQIATQPQLELRELQPGEITPLGIQTPGPLGPAAVPQELAGQVPEAMEQFRTEEGDPAGPQQQVPGAPEALPVPPAGADPQTDRAVTGAPPSATAQALSDVPLEQQELDERAKAAGETNAANIMGAQAREAAAQEQLDISTEKDAEAEALREANIAERKERLASMDEQWDKLLNTKIEPKNIWRDGSTGQQLSAVVSAVLGGFLMHRTGGKNMGLELISKWIDRDLRAQVADSNKNIEALKGRRGLYKDWLDVTQDEEAAIEMSKAAALARVGLKLEADMARIDAGPKARAAASAMLADIYAQARKFKENGAAAALDAAKTRAEIKYKNAQTAKLYAEAGLTRAKAGAARAKAKTKAQLEAEGSPYAKTHGSNLVDPEAGVIISAVRGTTDNVTKLQTKLATTTADIRDLTELNRLALEVGREYDSSGYASVADWVAKSDDGARYNALWADTLDRLVRARSGAQTGEHEFDRLKQVVPFQRIASNPSGVRKSLRDLGNRQMQRVELEIRGQMRGLEPGTVPSKEEYGRLGKWRARNEGKLEASLRGVDNTPLGAKDLIKRVKSGDPGASKSAMAQMARDVERRPEQAAEFLPEVLKLSREERTVILPDGQGGVMDVDMAEYLANVARGSVESTSPRERRRGQGPFVKSLREQSGSVEDIQGAVGVDPTTRRKTIHKDPVRRTPTEFPKVR